MAQLGAAVPGVSPGRGTCCQLGRLSARANWPASKC